VLQTLLLLFMLLAMFGPLVEPDLDRSGKLVFSPFAAQSVGAEILVSGFQSIQRCLRLAVNQRVDRPVVGGGLFADFRSRRYALSRRKMPLRVLFMLLFLSRRPFPT
jgi:hypothetical protein